MAEPDVAIVGFGPVGAFAALQLAQAGLRVAVLERSLDPVILPRAVGLDGETLRAFQRLGFADALAPILQPPREGERICFTDSRRRELLGVQLPDYGPNGWRDVVFFDQPELEALLRALVAKDARIDVRLGHEVTGLEQVGGEVALRSRDVDGREATLRAAYVLGCDGAASFVRRAVGIDWLSLGYDQDWLVVDVVQGPGAGLPLQTMQVCDPERLTTYVCVKDPNRRWEFQLLPGETREEMLRPERIEALLRPWVAPEHYRIRRSAVYQFHAATASRWREGRVFLAGDAAHQTPPFLGQGLNAGFRDAVNLGWKIPLVHAGVCGDDLLDSYAAERDAHARDLVEAAVGIGRLMETLAAREAGRPDPHAGVAQKAPPAGQGSIVPPLRGGVLVPEQIGTRRSVGWLLRQPTLRRPDRTQCRLDELLGRGFAVVGRSEADLRLGAEAASVLARIGGRRVGLAGLEVTHGEPDDLFASHPAAVVRPDRTVFGVVDARWDLDRLLVELAARLCLRPHCSKQ